MRALQEQLTSYREYHSELLGVYAFFFTTESQGYREEVMKLLRKVLQLTQNPPTSSVAEPTFSYKGLVHPMPWIQAHLSPLALQARSKASLEVPKELHDVVEMLHQRLSAQTRIAIKAGTLLRALLRMPEFLKDPALQHTLPTKLYRSSSEQYRDVYQTVLPSNCLPVYEELLVLYKNRMLDLMIYGS